MHKFLFILIVLCMGLKAACAHPGSGNQQDSVQEELSQNEPSIGNTQQIDYNEQNDTSVSFHILPVSNDSMRSWKKAREFAYHRYLDSLLKAAQEKYKPKQYKPSSPGLLDRLLGSQIMQVILWIIAACFILFILYRLFLAQGVFRRNRRDQADEGPGAETEQLTGESDYDQLIGLATRAGNYRLAVRYQYLKTLHGLAARDKLVLAPDKTNYQYVTEISDPASRKEFAGLTLGYEYVWYGEFEINETVYRKMEQGFMAFNRNNNR